MTNPWPYLRRTTVNRTTEMGTGAGLLWTFERKYIWNIDHQNVLPFIHLSWHGQQIDLKRFKEGQTILRKSSIVSWRVPLPKVGVGAFSSRLDPGHSTVGQLDLASHTGLAYLTRIQTAVSLQSAVYILTTSSQLRTQRFVKQISKVANTLKHGTSNRRLLSKCGAYVRESRFFF